MLPNYFFESFCVKHWKLHLLEIEYSLYSYMYNISLSYHIVLRDKTTAVNNVRNTFETELKRQLATFERDLHELKCKQNNEIQDMESRCHQQLKIQEEKQQEIIAQYEARDETWQAEKEVLLTYLYDI